jgi:superfamily I DNA and/or RNA helicase
MVDVVGATCNCINTNSAFRDVPFNTVIVDESGQIQLHNLIVPLSRGERAILVGDHKQLPPVVQQEITDELDARGVDAALMKDSWFERLWHATDDGRKVILDTQYRCPAIISDYIRQFSR